MVECRQLPTNTVESYETLPEMYLGLGIDRNPTTGLARGAAHEVLGPSIDLAVLQDRDAVECLNALVRSNRSLLAYSSRTQELIRHFRRIDPIDPDHITWAEISRDYGNEAEGVAYSLNAYLGILHYLSQTETTVPSTAPISGIPTDALEGYQNLNQAYLGIGIDRDPATGIARGPLPRIPQAGLDLSIIQDSDTVASLERAVQGNPALVADLHRVQEILRGLRQVDRQDPDVLTAQEIQDLYGANAGRVLISINAYLGLLRHVSEQPGTTGSGDTGVNPWVVGGLVAGAAVLVGGTIWLLTRPRVTPPPEQTPPLERPIVRNPALRPVRNGAPEREAPPVVEPSSPPPPPERPPPPPERFVHADGGEIVVFPDSPSGRWTLGRGSEMAEFVPLVQDPTDPAYAKISRQHAEIIDHGDGSFSLRDLGSLNGTRIYRDDAVAWACEEIRIEPGRSVVLQEGDVIGFGSAEYRFRATPGGPLLDRMARGNAAFPAPAAPESVVEPLQISTPEQPLISRLRGAIGGEEVEIFMQEPNPSGNIKEKYVGRIVSVTGRGNSAQVEVRFGNNVTRTFRLDQILTVRGRGTADDLSSRYIHPRITNPQFRDRSVNLSGTSGNGMGVLIDYSDPRLTSFLDEYIRPIRDRLDRGEISERQAAEMVRQVVHDYVPYDRPRGAWGISIPNRLYRLGDFIETGVCNELAMLTQVSNQFVGIESMMEKGPFMSGRHAWVRGYFHDRFGRPFEVVLDPTSRNGVYEVGRDAGAQLYRDDSTPFAKDRLMTIVIDHSSDPPPVDRRGTGLPHTVRTGWEDVVTYRVDGDSVYNALRQIDPGLAEYYRDRISPITSPVTTMGELLDRISVIRPEALQDALQMATREGQPISQMTERAIYEMVARSAEGERRWTDPDPTTRSRRAVEFETRSRNAGGLDRNDNRVDPRREEERRERERLERERRSDRSGGPRFGR